MDEKIAQLAYARFVESEYLQEIASIEAKIAASSLSQQLVKAKELLAVARAGKQDAEDTVRSAALELYDATGDKQPHPAVKIVMSTMLYYDPGIALEYCAEHLPKALKLDKKTFEEAAKVIEPEFVTISQEPGTRIDSDLLAYLVS